MAGFSPPKSPSYPKSNTIGAFLLGFVSAWIVLQWSPPTTMSPNKMAKHSFRGPQYWKPGQTQNAVTLYETAFARFQLHQVLLEDGRTRIDDWMWYDEGDNVNVLVQTERGTFAVLRQTKYALTGDSYAVLGGLIEMGEETPLQAAQRELKEELGMRAEEWRELGSYRGAANRGGGITHSYLALRAGGGGGGIQAQMAPGELERQTLLDLSKEELYEALLQGKFQEVKWTATVALALIHLDRPQ